MAVTGNPLKTGAGIGLRRALMDEIGCATADPRVFPDPDFLEVAPENWIGVGGRLGREFKAVTERYPLLCHGLSLSIGSRDPLDWDLLREIRRFLDEHQVHGYSEHLSYCSDGGHLYDLFPIPFTAEAVKHTADRICQVQDFLDRRIALENISYYGAPGAELSEIDFLKAVLEESDCLLLLDINNVHVNSVNHGYDPLDFLAQVPGERIAWLHVAGHAIEDETLLVDTHGTAVADAVWDLLSATYQRFGPLPTVLERDFNLPPLVELLTEVEHIRDLQRQTPAAIPARLAMATG